MPPGVLAEHGAWMLEMRMLRAETPADGISAAGKYWTLASPGSLHIRPYPTPCNRNWPDVASWQAQRTLARMSRRHAAVEKIGGSRRGFRSISPTGPLLQNCCGKPIHSLQWITRGMRALVRLLFARASLVAMPSLDQTPPRSASSAMSNKIAQVPLDFSGAARMCGGNKGVDDDGSAVS